MLTMPLFDSTALLAAGLVCIAGVMSPGPNFIAVTHRAVSAPRAEALGLVIGIACVNTLWAGAALFGLSAVFAIFPFMFWTVKMMGAAYLLYFGVQLLRRAGQALASKAINSTSAGMGRALRDGIVTNLANPKSMIFYASVFSAAVPAGAGRLTLSLMVLMVALIALLWYGGVALVLSSARAAALYRRGKPAIERSCGLLLIGFGLRQALAKS